MASTVPVNAAGFCPTTAYTGNYTKTPFYPTSSSSMTPSTWGAMTPSTYGPSTWGAMAPWGFENTWATPYYGGYPANFGPFAAPREFGAVTPFAGNWNNWVAPFERTFDRTFRNMDRTMRDMERRFSSELNMHASRPSSYLECYSLTNPIRYDADGNRWLNCYFDLCSFKPEECTVTLDSKNRCLNVEAVHEVKDSKEHYVKRHYSRKVVIPESVKCDLSKLEIKSFLNNEGLLCVEAALPRATIEEGRVECSASNKMASCPTVYKVATKTI